MNRRQFLQLGLILPFMPQIKALPQFEQNGLTFPISFAESEPEYKPMGTSEVGITHFKADNLITKIWHWLQTIK
jgi:hypothetical protein